MGIKIDISKFSGSFLNDGSTLTSNSIVYQFYKINIAVISIASLQNICYKANNFNTTDWNLNLSQKHF